MKVGSIVICVDDSNWSIDAHENFNKLPVKGQIYRISQIYPHYTIRGGPPGVSIEGIVGRIRNLKTYWGQYLPVEWHFKICRFKEIDLLSNSVELIEEVENEKHVIEEEVELIE